MTNEAKVKTKLTGGQIGVFVTLMLMLVVAPEHSAVNAVSQQVMDYYGASANAIAYLISITNIAEVPIAFLFGILVGRKISYRTTALFATACVIIGGLPTFFGTSMSFVVLMVTRVILGFGLGCLMPLSNSVIALLFEKESVRATMMSVANIIFSIGMIVLNIVAGALGAIEWQYCWGIYLWCVIPFILSIFLLNPKNIPAPKMEDEKGEKVKIRLPAAGWLLLLMFLLSIIMSQSLFNLGGVTIAVAVTNPAIIATVFSLFSVGAMVAAVAFGPAFKFMGAQSITLFWLIGLVGYALWYVAHLTGSTALFFVAIILAGFGTNSFTIGCPMNLSTVVLPAVYAAVMGFSSVFQNGGGFLATIVDQGVQAVFGADAILSSVWIFNIVLGIIILVCTFFIGKKVNKVRESEDKTAAAA